jgi:hypothetical protein
MVQNSFYILLNIRTPEGFETFGKFNLGNKREVALEIYKQLKGTTAVDENTILTMDLMETVNGLPLNVQIRGCTLDELAWNCKILTKETFKLHNLKPAS